MSSQPNNPYSIAGKPIQGGLPADSQVIRFNFANNQWEYLTISGALDGTHTGLTDKEVAGIIDHADDSINAVKLRADSVITVKILDLNVTTAKINALAVIAAKIGALAVETAKIDNLAVTEPKINALAVTEPKLGALAVSLAKMKTEAGNANLFIGYDGTGIVVAKAGGGGGGGSLGNVGYLAHMEFLGNIRSDEGIRVAAGDLATLTAAGGKDMYLASAKCNFAVNSDSAAVFKQEVVLRINGVIIETVKYSDISSAGAGVLTVNYEFKNIGRKVLATQIIKLEVITIASPMEIEGFIECFEVDTGVDPSSV